MKAEDKKEWVERVAYAVSNDVHNGADYPTETLSRAFDEAAALGREDGQDQVLGRLKAVLEEHYGDKLNVGQPLSWDGGYDSALEAVGEAFGLAL